MDRAKRFSAQAMQELMNYPWHGNVRELENVVERLTVMSSEEEISTTLLESPEPKNNSEDFFYSAFEGIRLT